MKKLFAILVVFLMLFNSMGYLIVFKSMQLSVRLEMEGRIKNNLPENELIKIAVANSDQVKQNKIEWLEEGEFRFNGCMYDIVRQQVKNDSIVYYCINDSKEEQLFANLDHIVKQQSESNPLNGHQSEKLIKSMVKEAIPHNTEITKPFCISAILQTASIFYLTERTLDVISPPPKA